MSNTKPKLVRDISSGIEEVSARALKERDEKKHSDHHKSIIEVDDFIGIKSPKKFIEKLRHANIDTKELAKILEYENDLEKLQIELGKYQKWVADSKKRVVILFEGRDAAGKGGAIRRFIEHLNPREIRVVALPKPTIKETGQWYFQRYARQLPDKGEIVFFDRSWYNRAVVEPVNGFCTKKQYKQCMRQIPEFEHMLYEDGITVIKFWFSISKSEQQKRFDSRSQNPLKQWKLSPIDARAQELWDQYSKYKEMMFSATHTTYCPWMIIRANNKKNARLESIRHVLSSSGYEGKSDEDVSLVPDPNTIQRFHRGAEDLD